MSKHLEFLRFGLVIFVVACDGGPPTVATDAGPGFDDHSIERIDSREAYFANSAEGVGRRVSKFVITQFDKDVSQRDIRFLDGHFYTLHDEWWWFRLLNGRQIPGLPDMPVAGRKFDTIADIYAWARVQEILPLDLQWAGDDRLYSPRFYTLALTPPQVLGLGGLMHIEAREGRAERWLFELEYSDVVTHDELLIYFAELSAALPADIAGQLAWVVRSPVHEELAKRMEADQLQYHDRIVRYSELAVPGEVEVYAEGLTAGRLRLIRTGDPAIASTNKHDVLVLEDVPDWLPPAAGLITSVPQTPLAHVNVLARNRGIPNAYKGGVADDPSLDQLARVGAPVIVRATAPDKLEIVAIDEHQYTDWLQRQTPAIASVPWVDTSTLPLTIDLSLRTLADMPALRPIIGGKSAGFLALLHTPGVIAPDRPLAITVRPYAEHMATLDDRIDRMLGDPEFRSSTRSRYMVLEGARRFALRYRSDADQRFAAEYDATHPNGDVLGDIVRAGGLVEMIEDQPFNPTTLAELKATLRAHFSNYAVTQGLRFRSSSNVEDIEGFNGAGLYDSNTGFLDPGAQTDPSEQRKTVERAIRKTWASYWSAEAYEERDNEAIEHHTGHMGVLVHARFDDRIELSNGVVTLTLLPPGGDAIAVMELNVQKGAISVTNPANDGVLPEVDRVTKTAGGLSIVRVRGSNLVGPAELLFTDEALRALFQQTNAIAQAWLRLSNAGVEPARAGRTLTLDFEVKHVDAGWPALSAGPANPSRVVIKQARTLEPGLRKLSPRLQLLSFPRDVLARARRIERWRCDGADLVTTVAEAYTDPLIGPDVGYAVRPLSGAATVERGGQTFELTHLDFETVEQGDRTAGWQLTVALTATKAAEVGVTTLMMDDSNPACAKELLHATPEDFLRSLLP